MDDREQMKASLENQILKITREFKNCVDMDADDSSDEDISETALPRYQEKLKELAASCTSDTSDDFPKLIQAMARCVYASREVNTLYYPKKAKYLTGNELSLDDQKLLHWIKSALKKFINEYFFLKNLSSFQMKFAEALQYDFLESKTFEKMLDICRDFFSKRRRLLFIISQSTPARFPLVFEPLILRLQKIFNKYLNALKIDYSSPKLEFSIEFLVSSTPTETRAEMRNFVLEYLLNVGLTKKRTGFVHKPDREKAIKKAQKKEKDPEKETDLEKETDPVKLAILEKALKITSSNQGVETFVVQHMSTFLLAHWMKAIILYEERRILFEIKELRQKRTFFRMNHLSEEFNASFFGTEAATCLKKIQKSKDETATEFYIKLSESFKTTKTVGDPSLERTLLPSIFTYENESLLHIIIFTRLLNRSQTRSIRQRSEDARKTVLSIPAEKVVRGLYFPCIQTTGIETEDLSINSFRTDKVINLGSYRKVFERIDEILKKIRISDQMFAQWLRCIMRNEKIVEPSETVNNLSKPGAKLIYKLLADLAYMLFVSETSRNPSCWIIHQMMLDLIEQGFITWEMAFTYHVDPDERQDLDSKKPPTLVRHLMPMAAKEALKGARYIIDQWSSDMLRIHSYKGEADTSMAKKILSGEEKIIKLWIKNICKLEKIEELEELEELEEIEKLEELEKIGNPSGQELCRLIKNAIKNKWYGIDLDVAQTRNGVPLLFTSSVNRAASREIPNTPHTSIPEIASARQESKTIRFKRIS